jgi:allantoinase
VPDLVIRGGTLITSAGTRRGDVAIEDGLIAAIAPELPAAREEIDARDLVIFPGLIDDHVHFNEPGRADWEGAATGSRALAAGGGTLFFDMPLNSSPCTIGRPEFDQKRQALERASITDFALWGGMVPGNREALAELADCGVVGYKAFMSDSGLADFPRADDVTLYEGMREAARLGLPVSVHAESEELTKTLARRAAAEGRTGIRDYLDSRPVLAEVEAIQRATLLAAETGAKLHIVHVSSGRGVVAAAEARSRGADVSIETCPHYLFFTEDDLLQLGAVAKCAPPLRSADVRETLWKTLLEGVVDIVASDHSPSPPAMKQGSDFFRIWGGVAGVQSTLAVLLDEGHHRRGLPLTAIARLTATEPARRFRVPGKGSVETGMDADLTLIDLNTAHSLKDENLFQKHKFTPYAARTFRGTVRRTLLRGSTIFADGRILANGGGKLVRPNLTNKAPHATIGIHT